MMEDQLKKAPLITVKNLKKHFKLSSKRYLHAVDDVSFEIYAGETLGLVGESGCGKSTVGNLLLRLHEATSGELWYRDIDVFRADPKTSLDLRKKIQIVFQDPYSSLNPRKTIKDTLKTPFQLHGIRDRTALDEQVVNICNDVGIPTSLLDHYPHELDGGMRQIVGIARALALNPEFIVCDEPLSALDVSIQAKIINLLIELQKKRNLAYLFISHDLSVVRHISDRIIVMYLGQVVEVANTDTIFNNTMHPYSIALLSAVPRVDPEFRVNRIVLQGDTSSPINPKPCCRFAQRCWMARPDCFEHEPLLTEVEPGHCVRCTYVHESRVEMNKTVKSNI